MSSSSAEKEATSWQRSKLRLWSGGIIEVRVREALPCLPPSFPLLPSFHSLLQQAHFTNSTSLTFYNFYVSFLSTPPSLLPSPCSYRARLTHPSCSHSARNRASPRRDDNRTRPPGVSQEKARGN